MAKRMSKRTKSAGKIPHIKTTIDGITFDSKMESEYYTYLKELKAKGEVIEFELQPKYLLQDKYIIVDGQVVLGSDTNFTKIKKQSKVKTIAAIQYIADFKVWYKDGTIKVIDPKGQSTPEFEIKKKLLLMKYPDIDFQVLVKSKGKWVDYYEYKKEQRARKREANKLKEESN